MAIGFLAALAHWVWTGRRNGRGFNFCSDLMLWTMVSGVIGARIAYVAANWSDYADEPWRILYFHEGGLVYYGGFIGAVLALAVFAVVKHQRILPFMDFVISALPLGHAFGRLGCFLNGCCHGSVTNLPWAIRYPRDGLPWCHQVNTGLIDRFTPETLPVHPVQIYEALFNLALYVVLLTMYRRNVGNGRVSAAYLLIYPVGRFLFEFLRGDARIQIGFLTMAQVFSLVLFMTGLGVMFYASRIRRPD